jgi:hypothetical protein
MNNELMINFMLMFIVSSTSFPSATRNAIFVYNILFHHIANNN